MKLSSCSSVFVRELQDTSNKRHFGADNRKTRQPTTGRLMATKKMLSYKWNELNLLGFYGLLYCARQKISRLFNLYLRGACF